MSLSGRCEEDLGLVGILLELMKSLLMADDADVLYKSQDKLEKFTETWEFVNLDGIIRIGKGW